MFPFRLTEDQIHVMIRQLADECNIDKTIVSETVNRMFESGLQYDNHDEVLKLLKPKVRLNACLVDSKRTLSFQAQRGAFF